MKRSSIHVSIVFCGHLVLGCVVGPTGNDTESAATSTTSTTSGSTSAAMTSAQGSTTGGAGDSAPTMATATTTAPATTVESSSTGEACSFLNCDDMMHGTKECDNFAQDCPDGQKCVAWADDGGSSWNALHCVDVTGTDKPGDPCIYDGIAIGSDSCIKGAMCWNYDEKSVGTCVPLCTGTEAAPVCDPPGACSIASETLLNLCIPTCDPLLQDCPNSSSVCIPVGDSFFCVLGSSQEGQANEPCEFSNLCDEGLMCFESGAVSADCDADASGCCTPFCAFPDGPCPNADQSCVQWYDPMQLPPNDPQLDIGFCGVPG